MRALPHQEAPDVVLMDIGLPGQSGTACVRALYPQYRDQIHFIMYTTHSDEQEVFDALASGAVGYILKGEPADMLAAHIREVQAGGAPMSAAIARKVVEHFNPLASHKTDTQRKALTDREWEVLLLVKRGLAYAEIGDALHISVHTVRIHIRNIYHKLQIDKWTLL
ncbi:MAG: hypothetical protein OHK0039_41830 [Bacteroidia bacterium]